MEVQDVILFSRKDFGYSVLDNLFYKIDYEKHTVKEIDFDELLVDYLFNTEIPTFKKFMKIYVNLCINKIGIDFDYIRTSKDLDAVVELFFSEGMELVEDD